MDVWVIVACVAVLYVLGKIFKMPGKIISRVIMNIFLGLALLFLVNYIGGYFNYHIELNKVSSFIIGILGVPGVFALMVLKYLNI